MHLTEHEIIELVKKYLKDVVPCIDFIPAVPFVLNFSLVDL